MKTRIVFLTILVGLLVGSCKKSAQKEDQQSPEGDSITVIQPIDTVHTSQNSIDWEGEYKGIMPCEDCDGVETALMLNFDYTFTQSVTYIGKGGPYLTKGTFSCDETGFIGTLKFEDGSLAQYLVGEGTISLLDMDGSPLEGDEYVLRK